MRLNGKKIFVTGGTGGIGVPLVARLRDAGAEVSVHSRTHHGDLTGDIAPLCAQLAEDTPDILINLAGYNVFGYCEDQDMESLIRLNLTVPMQLTQAVLPAMKRRGHGKIVNIGSMTALIPLPHMTGYVAAKAGLKGFSDSLRRELQGSGVSVCHITPRAVKTAANKGLKALLNEQTGVRYDSAEKVAAIIVAAIENEKSDARIGWPERFFAILNALIPGAVDNGLQENRRIGEKILQHHHKSPHTNTEKKTAMKTALIASLLMLSLTGAAQAQSQPAAMPQMGSPMQMQSPARAPLMISEEPADNVMAKVADLQTRWAEIKYKSTDNDKKIAAMAALEKEAEALVIAAPDRAEAKIWDAIILSTEAGFIKGLSALPKVKKAKALLENALQTNPQALDGSAYTSLGSLYYQVPGWPVAFGDKEKAEKYLKAALIINPDGIDPNYFYGDFLIHQGKHADAIPVLEKALAAPDRAGRTLADEGRRQEIRAALATAREKADKEGRKKSYN